MDAISHAANLLGQYVLTITAPLLVAVGIFFLFAVAKAALKALNTLALPSLARVLIVAAENKLSLYSGPEKMDWVVDKVISMLPNLPLKRDQLRATLQAIYDLTAADPTAPIGTSAPVVLAPDTVQAIGLATSTVIDPTPIAEAIGEKVSDALDSMVFPADYLPSDTPTHIINNQVDLGPALKLVQDALAAYPAPAPTEAAPAIAKKVATKSEKAAK